MYFNNIIVFENREIKSTFKPICFSKKILRHPNAIVHLEMDRDRRKRRDGSDGYIMERRDNQVFLMCIDFCKSVH